MLNNCIIKLAVYTLLISSVISAPTDNSEVKLLSYENSPPMKEGYKFMYETSDGTVREEMGIIMNPGTPEEELVVVGRYSYQTDDDNVVTVMYMADKNGYRPKVMLRSKQMKKQPMLKKDAIKSLIG